MAALRRIERREVRISGMPTVSHEQQVNAAPARVWEFVTALRYLPVWMDGIVSVRSIGDAGGSAGTTFTIVRRGHHEDESWIVAEYEAPRRIRMVEYRRDHDLILLLLPDPVGTRLRMKYTWPSARGILDRILRPTAQEQMVARSLARLREMFSLNQDIKLIYGMGDE
jgi:hypothetical protein